MKKIIWFFKTIFFPESSDANFFLTYYMWFNFFSQFVEEDRELKTVILIIIVLASIVMYTTKSYGLVRFATIAVLIWLALSRDCLDPLLTIVTFIVPILFGLWLLIRKEIRYED